MSLLVLSVPSYAALAEGIAVALNEQSESPEPAAEMGSVERRVFTDGEVYQRITREVRGRDVVLVAGTPTESDTLQAFDLACAVARYGAASLTWVLPYFGCQTMERAVRPGEVVTAKTRARLISAVPSPPGGMRVLLLDLHTAGLPHYFGDSLNAFHLYAKPLVLEAALEFGGDDFVLASPDAGRAKWVQSLANDLRVPAAFIYKRRHGSGMVEVTGVNAAVKGKRVVIYDDMIRTGGTLLQAARAYLEAGAERCYAVTTHLVVPGDAAATLMASDELSGIAGTDSHPRSRVAAAAGCDVRSVAPVFAEWLKA
ncbi:MAG TPA: ribose-phosphate pyrophosphokinase [Planctomycetes bacterium]|nr:ribose-phosphate pyrophosphokinase [Planctomycetota bacterium]